MPQEVAQMYVVCLAPSELPNAAKAFSTTRLAAALGISMTAEADSVHLVRAGVPADARVNAIIFPVRVPHGGKGRWCAAPL